MGYMSYREYMGKEDIVDTYFVLELINLEDFIEFQKIHIRGGMATRQKYKKTEDEEE